MIKKGDKVVMHTCIEAGTNEGIVWTCQTDEQKHHPKHDYTVVWLEGFSGSFASKYLRKIGKDEETVQCILCKKEILQDSDGYVFDGDMEIGCKKCAKEEEAREQLAHQIKKMKITHTVFKNEDVEAMKSLAPQGYDGFQKAVAYYQGTRRILMSNPEPKYIVINTDEPYVEEIIKVLKRHGHWD